MTPRQKGLQKVRLVKQLLIEEGFLVEGPFYRSIFNPATKRPMAVHYDPFNCDLISYKKNVGFELHQICERGHKSEHDFPIEIWLWTYKKGERGFKRELIKGEQC